MRGRENERKLLLDLILSQRVVAILVVLDAPSIDQRPHFQLRVGLIYHPSRILQWVLSFEAVYRGR